MKLLNRQIELQVTAASLPREQHPDRLFEVPGSRYEEPPSIFRRKPVPLRVVGAPPKAPKQVLSGQRTDLVNSNASPLGRSGAVRGGRPLRLPRSATFNAPPVDGRPGFIARAETWATADEHRQAYEAA
jgi:hypothetical protein